LNSKRSCWNSFADYCDGTEGELEELIEEFNDGKVQFAFVKVKDPNSGLPKFVLICWVSSHHCIFWRIQLTRALDSVVRAFRRESRATLLAT
jgi:hypothetical protein